MTGKAKYTFLTETGQADDIFTTKANGTYNFYAVNNFSYPGEIDYNPQMNSNFILHILHIKYT